MAEYTPGYKKEIPDPTPVELPVGFKHPPTLQEEIQRLIRSEMSRAAADAGMETFEEADDFAVDDDDGDFVSPYELTELQEESNLSDASNLDAKGDENGGSKDSNNEGDAGAGNAGPAGGKGPGAKGTVNPVPAADSAAPDGVT